MANIGEKMYADVVVAGSGPGGSTVARELSKLGKKVIIMERGDDHKWIGNTFAMARMADQKGMLFSKEGTHVIRILTTGGSSLCFCGTVTPPPEWLKTKYGIDLDPYLQETRQEIGIAPLPDRLRGQASINIMLAAQDMGINWEPIEKFINPEICDLSCPYCMFGCKKGAKWSARVYAYEAVENGAELVSNAMVDKVIVQEKEAVGVEAITPKGRIEAEAKAVVISAGGMGTPVILQRSGLFDAGQGFFADPLVMTYGIYDGPGSLKDIPMTFGTADYLEEGIMMTDLIDPWSTFLFNMFRKGFKYMGRLITSKRTLGIMTKVRDGLDGRINLDGTFSKPITYEDHWKLDKGANLAEKILVKAGCDPDNIFSTPIRAAHPGGTARIGEVVDSDLQTEIKNLFVCDTSIIPEPWGLPPVFSLVGFGKRLVDTKLRNLV